MDSKPLTYKVWDVDESLSEKKGYYGINYTYNGLELCFGKYDYNRHEFTLNYKISNFVLNTSDSQVIYWNLIDRLSSVDFENFSIVLSSYYEFPNDLPVWGYGHKGYAYVENGKIYMSNEDDMNGQYVVLLAKFPLNTFNTTNSSSRYDTFDDVLTAAENGSFDYDYSYESSSDINPIFAIFITIYTLFMIALPFILIRMLTNSSKYGFINNKTITKKNTPYFRDIPCNKDIFRAYYIGYNYGLLKKKTDLLGAIILKWIKYSVIRKEQKGEKGIFKKENILIYLNETNPEATITNEKEKRLFKMLYEASKDGILENKEFEKWCNKSYSRILRWFDNILEEQKRILVKEGMITIEEKKTLKIFKNKIHTATPELKQEAMQLAGLKKFLKEYTLIKDREAIEVTLFEEYLIYAQMMGIAKQVAKDFKEVYPEIIEQSKFNSYDNIIIINTYAAHGISTARSAESRARSYSSGGGGFSSGGGGGGSFGGGGGRWWFPLNQIF